MFSTAIIETLCFKYNKKKLVTLRALAFMVDAIILSCLIYGYLSLNLKLPDFFYTPLFLIMIGFYEPILESRFGYTIGKWLLGLRVVGKEGRNVTFLAALFRHISKLFSFFASFGFLSFLSISNSMYGQRVIDEVLDVFVVLRKDLKPKDYESRDDGSVSPLKFDIGDRYFFERREISEEIEYYKRSSKNLVLINIALVITAFMIILSISDLFTDSDDIKGVGLLIEVSIFVFLFWFSNQIAKGGRIANYSMVLIYTAICIFFAITFFDGINNHHFISRFDFWFFMAFSILILYWFGKGAFKSYSIFRANYNLDIINRPRLIDQLNRSIKKIFGLITDHSKVKTMFGLVGIIILVVTATIAFVGFASLALYGAVNEFTSFSFGLLRYVLATVKLVVIFASIKMFKVVNRLIKASVSTLRKYDERPPVLFIRSFKDDSITLKSNWFMSYFHRKTLDEVIDSHMSQYGPVVAIGEPGQRIPPLGVSRYYVTKEENWKDQVKSYLQECQVIVTIVGDTTGLEWEYQQIAELGLIHKLIIVIPPLRESILRTRWAYLEAHFPILKGEDIGRCSEEHIVAIKFKKDSCQIVYVEEDEVENAENILKEKAYKIALSILN